MKWKTKTNLCWFDRCCCCYTLNVNIPVWIFRLYTYFNSAPAHKWKWNWRNVEWNKDTQAAVCSILYTIRSKLHTKNSKMHCWHFFFCVRPYDVFWMRFLSFPFHLISYHQFQYLVLVVSVFYSLAHEQPWAMDPWIVNLVMHSATNKTYVRHIRLNDIESLMNVECSWPNLRCVRLFRKLFFHFSVRFCMLDLTSHYYCLPEIWHLLRPFSSHHKRTEIIKKMIVEHNNNNKANFCIFIPCILAILKKKREEMQGTIMSTHIIFWLSRFFFLPCIE